MPAAADRDADARTGSERPVPPADGPIEAALGFVLFYVVVDRATPTVVDVFAEEVLDLAPSLVGLALAGFLWFVLVVSVVDQVRRQLAALGLASHDAVGWTPWQPSPLSGGGVLGYGVLLAVGSLVAVLTVQTGLATAVELIPIVATLDVAAFPVADFVVMVVFFVSYGLATRALDRLVMGALRSAVAA
jgi:hypothetical protein